MFFFYFACTVQHFGDSPCTAAGRRVRQVRCVTGNQAAHCNFGVRIVLSAGCLLKIGSIALCASHTSILWSFCHFNRRGRTPYKSRL